MSIKNNMTGRGNSRRVRRQYGGTTTGGGNQTMGSPYRPAPRNAIPLGSPTHPLRPLSMQGSSKNNMTGRNNNGTIGPGPMPGAALPCHHNGAAEACPDYHHAVIGRGGSCVCESNRTGGPMTRQRGGGSVGRSYQRVSVIPGSGNNPNMAVMCNDFGGCDNPDYSPVIGRLGHCHCVSKIRRRGPWAQRGGRVGGRRRRR